MCSNTRNANNPYCLEVRNGSQVSLLRISGLFRKSKSILSGDNEIPSASRNSHPPIGSAAEEEKYGTGSYRWYNRNIRKAPSPSDISVTRPPGHFFELA